MIITLRYCRIPKHRLHHAVLNAITHQSSKVRQTCTRVGHPPQVQEYEQRKNHFDSDMQQQAGLLSRRMVAVHFHLRPLMGSLSGKSFTE